MNNRRQCRYNRGVQYLLLILSAFVLAACEEEKSVEPDSDPYSRPVVISTYPQVGSTGPYSGKPVSFLPFDGGNYAAFYVKFSKEIDTRSVNSKTVHCDGFDDTPLIIAVSPSQDGTLGDLHRFDLYYGDVNDEYYPRRRPYEIGRKYTVRLDTGITDTYGNHLQYPFSFQFTPEPGLRIVAVDSGFRESISEWGEVSIANISLDFNSPLGKWADSKFHFEPHVDGAWQINNRAATFMPSAEFVPGTSYRLIIESGLQDTLGHMLGSDVTLAMPIPALRFIPQPPAFIYLNSALELRHSGGLDTRTFVTAFRLSPPGGYSLVYSRNRVLVRPVTEWKPSTLYQYVILPYAKDIAGKPIGDTVKGSFQTRAFEMIFSRPVQNEIGVEQSAHIVLYFSAAIDTGSARNAFSIEPATAGTIFWSPGTLYFIPDSTLKSQTLYTVRVNTNLRTRGGYILERPDSVRFWTRSN